MKLSLSWIAVITCLAIVGLSAGGCSRTTSGAMADVSKPSIDMPRCYRAQSPVRGCVKEPKRAALKKDAEVTVAHARTPPVARCRQSRLWDVPEYLQEQRTMTKAAAESEGHPMPWRPAEKPTKSTPAPTTRLPEECSAPLHYQEESQGHPMPWRPAEKPDAEGGTS